MRSNRDYIKILYQALLGRKPDEEGENYFLEIIKKNKDLRYIIDSLLDSDEYKLKNNYREHISGLNNSRQPYVWNETNKQYSVYTKHKNITSILVVCLDHIGDLFLSIDAFKLIKESYPTASIDMLCGPWNKNIATNLRIFDVVYEFNFFDKKAQNQEKNIRINIDQLNINKSYDLVVDMRIQSDTREVFKYINAKYKCGFSSENYSNLDIALEPISSIPGQLSQSHHRMQKLRLVHSIVDFLNYNSFFGEEIKKSITNISNNLLIEDDKKISISIHPFSGKEIKNWSAKNYLEIINWLSHEYDVIINILGSQEDIVRAKIFSDCDCSTNIHNIVGKLSLTNSLNVIANSDLFIGNDSGLAHAAARMNIPTIAIFSGIDLPDLYAPYGADVSIIKVDVGCSPCYKKTIESCEFKLECLELIEVDKVKGIIEKKLSALKTIKFDPKTINT